MTTTKRKKKADKQEEQKKPYKTPKVIHEGTITTRAGSPTLTGEGDSNAVDPADLFGGGN